MRRCEKDGCERELDDTQERFCSLSCSVSDQNRRAGLRRRAEFDAVGRRCERPECGERITWERRENRFCSSRCAALELQRDGGHRAKPLVACAHCGVSTGNPKYCSRECSWAARNESERSRIEACDGQGISASALRRYMRSTTSSCVICGVTEWCGAPVPLVMDHIDGCPTNDSLSNLRMVCPNCDAQLPTFKSKNRGNGRAWRRERYHAGKSY